jgi:uncharacterized protein
VSGRSPLRTGVTLLLAGCAALALAQSGPGIEDLKRRAEAGDTAATRALAEAYYLGRDGAPQDFGQAAHWYLTLAKQGDARAQTSIGLLYARGLGVEKDLAAAIRWWSHAAAQNDPGAQFNLGLLHAGVEGLAPDYRQAVQWYTRAAQRGHIQAQHNLGMLYHEGKGVAHDAVRAYFWVSVAAAQGDQLARRSLQALGSEMSREDIDRVRRQAEQWLHERGQPAR